MLHLPVLSLPFIVLLQNKHTNLAENAEKKLKCTLAVRTPVTMSALVGTPTPVTVNTVGRYG